MGIVLATAVGRVRRRFNCACESLRGVLASGSETVKITVLCQPGALSNRVEQSLMPTCGGHSAIVRH